MNINELLHHISVLIGTDPAEALLFLRANEGELNKYVSGRLNKNGFLIDIGSSLEDEAIIMEGLEGIKKFMETMDKETPETQISLFPSALYNFANGFSGHGLQQGPAAGNAIAELIVHGAFRTIDLARFGYDRIRRKDPLFEKNVI